MNVDKTPLGPVIGAPQRVCMKSTQWPVKRQSACSALRVRNRADTSTIPFRRGSNRPKQALDPTDGSGAKSAQKDILRSRPYVRRSDRRRLWTIGRAMT